MSYLFLAVSSAAFHLGLCIVEVLAIAAIVSYTDFPTISFTIEQIFYIHFSGVNIVLVPREMGFMSHRPHPMFFHSSIGSFRPVRDESGHMTNGSLLIDFYTESSVVAV